VWKDPIVEEIRKFRRQHAKAYNYDLDAICEAVKKQEQESIKQGRVFVSLGKKKPSAEEVKIKC